MKSLILIFLSLSVFIYGEVSYIASFNTLHLGWSREKEYDRIAEFLEFFDLVALQEVMTEEGMRDLVEALNERGEQWEYLISPHSTGRGDYKEYYAFVWKTTRVDLVRDEGYYTGGKRGFFERLPYGATFKVGEFDFTFINFQ